MTTDPGGCVRMGEMTAAPDVAPLAFDRLQDAIDALRAAGLRLSTPRRLILEALFAADGPASAAHLARGLEIDESSVYRNLELLEQHGLVRHVHLGHSAGLYGLVGREDVEYLYCERCTKVTAVAPERLDAVRALIGREFGHTARFTHFAVVGVCAECAREASPAPAQQLHSHGDHVHAHAHPH
jgi:Fur family transcriptional regulator, ferric uptake regulator